MDSTLAKKLDFNFLHKFQVKSMSLTEGKKVSNNFEESGHSALISILGHMYQVIPKKSYSELEQ